MGKPSGFPFLRRKGQGGKKSHALPIAEVKDVLTENGL